MKDKIINAKNFILEKNKLIKKNDRLRLNNKRYQARAIREVELLDENRDLRIEINKLKEGNDTLNNIANDLEEEREKLKDIIRTSTSVREVKERFKNIDLEEVE